MKLSLILNVIDPRIGGVMVMGERGTGKTTAVRALADLLPQIRVRLSDGRAPPCPRKEKASVHAHIIGIVAQVAGLPCRVAIMLSCMLELLIR